MSEFEILRATSRRHVKSASANRRMRRGMKHKRNALTHHRPWRERMKKTNLFAQALQTFGWNALHNRISQLLGNGQRHQHAAIVVQSHEAVMTVRVQDHCLAVREQPKRSGPHGHKVLARSFNRIENDYVLVDTNALVIAGFAACNELAFGEIRRAAQTVRLNGSRSRNESRLAQIRQIR